MIKESVMTLCLCCLFVYTIEDIVGDAWKVWLLRLIEAHGSRSQISPVAEGNL